MVRTVDSSCHPIWRLFFLKDCKPSFYKSKHQSGKLIFVITLVCLMLEVFVFNYAHWQSRTFNRPDSGYSLGTGIKKQSDGSLIITNKDAATLSFKPEGHVSNINIPLVGITQNREKLINPSRPTLNISGVQVNKSILHVTISADEQGSTIPWVFPERVVDSNVASSKWIRLYLSGKSHQVTVRLNEDDGTQVKFNGQISLNSRRPFIVNPLRVIFYICAVLIAILLPVFRRNLSSSASHTDRRVLWTVAFAVALMVTEGALAIMRPWQALRESAWPADFEYQWMAQSIINGHSWIDFPVPRTLQHMTDPYDPGLRQQLLNSSGERFLYDFVLFKGRYYSYFGVLPCLVFFVPFKLITGADLSAWKVVAFLLIIIAVLAFLIVRILFKRFAPSVPPLVRALSALGLTIVSQPALYLSLTNSATYSVPIASAIVLAEGAIYFWLLASMQCSRTRFLVYTFLGGLLAGLIAGCRPQISIIVLLAPVILAEKLNMDRLRGIRLPWLKAAISAAVPFLIGVLFFLWWNHIRFGNYFDFGATYQLTTTDMRAPKSIISKVPFAFIQSLFMPLGVQDQFPFFKAISGLNSSQGGYQGAYVAEPLLGGVLFWFPLGWLLFYAFRQRVRKSPMNRSGIASLLYSCLLLCVILLVVDVSVTFLTRYMSDWGFIFGIASISAIIMIINATQSEMMRHHLYVVIAILVLISLCLCVVAITMNGRFNQLIDSNPTLFVFARDTFSVFS